MESTHDDEINSKTILFNNLSTILKKRVREESELIDFLQNSRLSLSEISMTFPLGQDKSNQNILYHRYYVSGLLQDESGAIPKVYDSGYRIFTCDIWDNSNSRDYSSCNENVRSNVFVKTIPCYDISTYLDFHCETYFSTKEEEDQSEKEDYSSKYQSEIGTSVLKINTLESKLQNKMNSCYTESIACLLVSRLTEESVIPHFPRVFGIFSAKAESLPIHFTDEFTTYHGSDEFEEGVNKGLWSVLYDEGDDESDESSDYSFDDFSMDEEEEDEEEEEEDEEEEEENEKSLNSSFEDRLCQDYSSCSESQDAIYSDYDEEDEEEEEEQSGETESYSSQLSFKSMKLEDLNFDLNTFTEEVDLIDKLEIKEMVIKEINELQTNEAPLEIPRKRYSHGSTSYLSQQSGIEKYIVVKDMPCQVIAMEGFPIVLEDVLSEDYKTLISTYIKMKKSMTTSSDRVNIRYCFYFWLLTSRQRAFDRKWIAILFQVVMALIAMNHFYDMIHNDLHTQNILFEPTSKSFLTYKINSNIYKVPTFGYIIKIIDFGRATYRLFNDELIMGDVFKAKGEAGEQFAYPYENFIKNPKAVPNRSFDLCRLGCSILEEVFGSYRIKFITQLKFYELIRSWTIDDQGKSILRFTGFDLYKQIVRRVHHLEPLEQLKNENFQDFLCKEIVDFSECFHVSNFGSETSR
jgi:hypothetical protein